MPVTEIKPDELSEKYGYRRQRVVKKRAGLIIDSEGLNTLYMYFNQLLAAKGERNGNGARPLLIRSMQRAAVNIHKTDTAYEMLVFAPGRIKEHFRIDIDGRELKVSYTPPEGFPRHEWVLREYSRGGFVRTFTLDDSIDTSAITARYQDGVLQVTLPLVQGKQVVRKEIVVN